MSHLVVIYVTNSLVVIDGKPDKSFPHDFVLYCLWCMNIKSFNQHFPVGMVKTQKELQAKLQ